MQLSQSKSDAILVGDIQNNKVGIDRDNIGFITTLLSTNLYSKPIQSFLRETVANGWDSQVEAHNTETPLLIRMCLNKEGEIEVAVRDYGTGLSPERFDTIYKNIGSSTKRDSNDFIGCMGIGRFSALACSNVVKIKSFYEGKCYSYLMYKDGVSICIDKTSEVEGEYANGVEVCVTVGKTSTNIESIKDGIKSLAYFEGVYIDSSVPELPCDAFNKRQIHDFDAFKVCNLFESGYGRGSVKVLMGNVLYPVEGSMAEPFFGANLPNIALKCNIGDLEITPNRENLIYNAKTRDSINSRLKESLKEVLEITKASVSQDWPSVEEWFRFRNEDSYTTTIFKFDNIEIDWVCSKNQLFHKHGLEAGSTIKGSHIPANFLTHVKKFKNMAIPERMITYRYKNDMFQITRIGSQNLDTIQDRARYGGVYTIDSPLKPIAKRYFREEVFKGDSWRGALMINPKDMRLVFFQLMRKFILYVGDNPSSKRIGKYPKESVRLLWDDFKEVISKIPSFSNDDVPQAYKDANKPAPKQRSEARKCVVYTLEFGDVYDYSIGLHNVRRNSEKYDSQSLSKLKGTVIYDVKKSDDLEDMFILMNRCKEPSAKYYTFVEVAPSNIPIIQANKNCVSLQHFIYSNNPVLSRVLTRYHITRTLKIQEDKLYEYSKINMDEKSPLYKAKKAIEFVKDVWNKCRDFPIDTKRPGIYLEALYQIYSSRNWLNYKMISEAELARPFMAMDNFVDIVTDKQELVNDILLSLYLLQNNTFKGDVKTIQGLRGILAKLKIDEHTKNPI